MFLECGDTPFWECGDVPNPAPCHQHGYLMFSLIVPVVDHQIGMLIVLSTGMCGMIIVLRRWNAMPSSAHVPELFTGISRTHQMGVWVTKQLNSDFIMSIFVSLNITVLARCKIGLVPPQLCCGGTSQIITDYETRICCHTYLFFSTCGSYNVDVTHTLQVIWDCLTHCHR